MGGLLAPTGRIFKMFALVLAAGSAGTPTIARTPASRRKPATPGSGLRGALEQARRRSQAWRGDSAQQGTPCAAEAIGLERGGRH